MGPRSAYGVARKRINYSTRRFGPRKLEKPQPRVDPLGCFEGGGRCNEDPAHLACAGSGAWEGDERPWLRATFAISRMSRLAAGRTQGSKHQRRASALVFGGFTFRLFAVIGA